MALFQNLKKYSFYIFILVVILLVSSISNSRKENFTPTINGLCNTIMNDPTRCNSAVNNQGNMCRTSFENVGTMTRAICNDTYPQLIDTCYSNKNRSLDFFFTGSEGQQC